MKSSFFWVVTQRLMLVAYRRVGAKLLGPSSRVEDILTLQGGTGGLSRNVGKTTKIRCVPAQKSEDLLSLPGIEPWFLRRPARSVGTLPTGLSSLPLWTYNTGYFYRSFSCSNGLEETPSYSRNYYIYSDSYFCRDQTEIYCRSIELHIMTRSW